MIRVPRWVSAFLFVAGTLATAAAQETSPASPRPAVKIGFVEIENDPRYEPIRAYERITLKTREHPYTGAELGVDDAAALARVLPADFALESHHRKIVGGCGAGHAGRA